MKPVAFSYHRATSLDDALAFLADHPEGKILAGGQSLIPMMNFRLSRPAALVDITALAGLDRVEDAGETLRIGGLIRHQALHENALVRDFFPALSEAAGHVGHWAIRNRGTLGGSLVHADPASELPAAMVALGAVLELASADGSRFVPAREFYLGFLTVDIQPDEMLVRVDIPKTSDASFGFAEFARRPGDFALAGAFVELRKDRSGAITWFGVSGRPERVEVEFSPDTSTRKMVFTEAVEGFDPLEEGPYRKRLAIESAERAFEQATGRQTGWGRRLG